MSDYIKREDAEAVIDKQYNRADESLGFGDIEGVKTGILWGKALIASLPSADVVERSEYERKADYARSLEAHFVDWEPVVRCQDCAFWGCVKKGRCGLTRYPTRPHDYCSYGERREEQEHE